MKTLFIFTKSPYHCREMEEWLPRADENDAVLLIQDAVVGLNGGTPHGLEKLKTMNGRLFASKADVTARGVHVKNGAIIDDAEIVKLIAEYDRVASL